MVKKKYDDLSIRMKGYEHAYRFSFPKRLPIIIRLDGKAFHSFTKGMKRPFDEGLANAMWETVKFLCKNIQGCKIGYTQSDEITLLLTNYENINSQSWFDNNKTKMETISASMATAKFNEEIHKIYPNKGFAYFDSRAFVLPKEEVTNNLIWRQQDAIKNSVSMVAQANFSHKSLQGLNGLQIKERLKEEKGIVWDELPTWQKRGIAVIKEQVPKTTIHNGEKIVVYRNEWVVDQNMPVFTEDREYIERYV